MFKVWFLKILRYCWACSKWNYLMHFSLNLIVYIHWILIKLKRDIILFGSIKQKHLPGMCMFRHTVRDFVESAFNSRMWVTKDGQVQSLFHPVFVVIYSYLTNLQHRVFGYSYQILLYQQMSFWKIWNVTDFAINRGILFLFLKKMKQPFEKKKKLRQNFIKPVFQKK